MSYNFFPPKTAVFYFASQCGCVLRMCSHPRLCARTRARKRTNAAALRAPRRCTRSPRQRPLQAPQIRAIHDEVLTPFGLCAPHLDARCPAPPQCSPNTHKDGTGAHGCTASGGRQSCARDEICMRGAAKPSCHTLVWSLAEPRPLLRRPPRSPFRTPCMCS